MKMVGGAAGNLGSPGAKVIEVMFHAVSLLVLSQLANYCQGILNVCDCRHRKSR